MRRIRKRMLGASAVEFALVFVILFALLFAAIEFCRVMFVTGYAMHATHSGARTAAIVGVNARSAGTAAYQQVTQSMYLDVAGFVSPVVTVEFSSTGVASVDPDTGESVFDDNCGNPGGTRCAFARVGLTWSFSWIAPFRPVPWDQLLMAGSTQGGFATTRTYYTTLPIEAMGRT